MKDTTLYSWWRANKNLNHMKYPNKVFGFSGYPSIFIFEKKGNTIYHKTGFSKETEEEQRKSIENILGSNF